MADGGLPPLVAISGGATRGPRYGNQVSTVVDVHQPFEGMSVEKRSVRLPDGIVIRPDPGMPALMSVSYEEPMHYDQIGGLSRPKELGQVKVLPHADCPVIKQEVCDTLDVIKERLNQTDTSNGVHSETPPFAWLNSPQTSRPKPQMARKSVQSVPILVNPFGVKKTSNVAKKRTTAPAKILQFNTAPTQAEQKKGQKGQKRKLEGGSLLESAISRLKKSKVSAESANSSIKETSISTPTSKSGSTKEVDISSIDPYQFDDLGDVSTPVAKSSTTAIKSKKATPSKGSKSPAASPEKVMSSPVKSTNLSKKVSSQPVATKKPANTDENGAQKKMSSKKKIPLRIALKEPKKPAKSSNKSKPKAVSPVKGGKGKESDDSFTQLKQITKKVTAGQKYTTNVSAASTSAIMNLSVTESPVVVPQKKGIGKKAVEKKTSKESTKDKSEKQDKRSDKADAVIMDKDEPTNKSGDDKIPDDVVDSSSSTSKPVQSVEDEIDDDLIIVPPPPDNLIIEPIIIEPSINESDSTDLSDPKPSTSAETNSKVTQRNATGKGTQANAVSADVALSIYLDLSKKVANQPVATKKPTPSGPVEDPVPLRWSAPKSRVCDYPPKARSRSPNKGKSQDKRGRMTSPLRSPLSPGSAIHELEAEDMDLALDIASRIQDQFTEAEFEQLFNSGPNNSSDKTTTKVVKATDAKDENLAISKLPPGKSKAPLIVMKGNYKFLDCYIPLNDCKAFKKKSQTLLKVPPRRNQLFRCEVCKGVFIDYQAFTLHKWSHEKEKFACSECNTFYTSEKNLQWHIKVTHKKTGNFKCKFCPKRFLHEQYKKEHERLHTGTSKYKCRICGKMFFGMTGYRGHMRRHLGFEPFKCKKCGQGFALLQELNCHVIRHSGDKKFKCRFCGKGFYGMYECKRHEFSHSGERPYRCKYCGKRYSNKWSCEAHEKYHSGELEFQCPVCNKRFATKHQLRNHAMFHSDVKPFKCQYCEKAFVNRQILVCHERVHTKEKPFKCAYCEKSFAQASDRTAHQRIHTGERPYACKFCDRRFRKIGALKTHEKTHTGERTMKCRMCSWVFPDNEQVKKHEKRHNKQMPTPCFFCNRYFANLQEHDEVHQEEKEPFRCCCCNARFITFEARYLHERTHVAPRRYTCSVCNEDFCRRNVRDNHEKLMHSGTRERVPCPLCKKMYADEAAVRLHMKNIHEENRPTFQCKYCQKEFKNEDYKKRHENIHLGLDQKLQCAHCDYVTNRKYLMKIHEEKHLNGTFEKSKRTPGTTKKKTIFRVDENGDSIEVRSPSSLKKKERKDPIFKMDDTIFPCKEEGCDAVYESAYSLLAHMRKHSKEYPCDKCSEKFKNAKDFKDHIKKAHGNIKCKFCHDTIAVEDMTDHEAYHESEKDPYKCMYCMAGFISPEERETHEETHSGPKPYLCIVCNRTFPCKSLWTYHQRCHTGAKPYECLTCKKRFAMSSALTEHVRRIHVGGRQLKCRVCGKICDSQAEVKAHSKMHRHERRFKCDICPMAFYKGDHLNAHKQRHLGIKPFKCSVCNHGFSSRNGVNKHVAKFHSGNTENAVLYKCDVCPETFTSRHHFRIHRNTHKKKDQKLFQCSVCGQEFGRKSSWIQHEANHTSKGPHHVYKCDTCGRKFGSLGSLNYHMIFHGNAKIVGEPADDADDNTDNDAETSHNDADDSPNTSTINTSVADANVDGTDAELIIKKEISPNEDSNPTTNSTKKRGRKVTKQKEGGVACVICGLSFNQPRGLDRHMERVHPEVAPYTKPSEYTCAICDMSFPKKVMLMRHMKSHQLGMGEGSFELLSVPLEGVIGAAAAQLGDTNNNSPLAKDLSAAVVNAVSESTTNLAVNDTNESSVDADTSVAEETATMDDDDINDSTDPTDTSNSDKAFTPGVTHKCHICGQCFMRPSLLSKHLGKHKDQPVEQHECFLCQKVYSTPKGLKAHVSKSHRSSLTTMQKSAPHRCQLCPKVFWEVAGYKKHMLQAHKALDANVVEAIPTAADDAEHPENDTEAGADDEMEVDVNNAEQREEIAA